MTLWIVRTVAGLAALGVVASAATAVTYSPSELAGAAPSDDPDAPIATARYGDAPKPPVQLETMAGRVFVAEAAPPPTRAAPMAVALAPQEVRAPRAARAASARPRITFEQARAEIRPSDHALAGAPPSAFSPSQGGFNASAMIAKAAPSADRTGKSRWFLFAASSGKAFGLNMARDNTSGNWRRDGWSRERLAPFGQVQIGLAWRGVDRQLSIGATKRKIQVMDFSKEDTVFGVTWSVKAKS